jgi:hypothetical protein
MVGEKGGNGSVGAASVVKKVALIISTISFIRVSSPSLDFPHRENEFTITAGLLISFISHKLNATWLAKRVSVPLNCKTIRSFTRNCSSNGWVVACMLIPGSVTPGSEVIEKRDPLRSLTLLLPLFKSVWRNLEVKDVSQSDSAWYGLL